MTKPLRSRSCYGGCKGTHPTICEQEGCAIVQGEHRRAKELRPAEITGKDRAEWLADKICNGGDYAKEAASVLVAQAVEIERLKDKLKPFSASKHSAAKATTY